MNSNIFDMMGLVAQNVWLYGGAFILVLSILVFVHEFGHYYIARRCGVRIDSFSIGFGRELFGVNDRHGTRWKFSMVPLGGYVKMFGDVDPASAGHSEQLLDADGNPVRPLTGDEKKVAFYSQPVGKRAAIVFAGPAINFLFAIVVLTVLYATVGQPVTPAVGAAVVEGSAAERAGFQPNDEILAIDGVRVHRFEDIKREVLVGLDTSRTFTIRRGDRTLDIQAAPERKEEKDRFGFKHETGLLGLISPGNGIDIKSIKAIDGKKTANADDTRARLNKLMGTTFTLDLNQGDDVGTIIVHPVADQNEDLSDEKGGNHNVLIVSATRDQLFVRHAPLSALFAAVDDTRNITVGTLQAVGQIIDGTRSANELGGIIRIGAIAGDMAKAGIIALVTFTALLSINLGLINLFPIPMLDGGHLLFYGVESLKGSPIPERIQEYAFRVGLAMLVGIMVFANLNDLIQLIL
jgi:regulator of sigma E protease